ncbi:uncharacterized protein A4U43_C10F6900 [Asparagus officinalis]|uniref:Tf2-1-like SH3-like domain-containing protein n=1 Tax=Asparagus officinalis TaxID=4686 RepID=A0A5P1E161_ASPOF|nr:uncharacterized protein A4U43_C10F6900 [Asparagus officinalis]
MEEDDEDKEEDVYEVNNGDSDVDELLATSLGTMKKLHARRTGPYRVILHIGPNVYELDLLKEMGINLVFNIEDLVSYTEPMDIAAFDEAIPPSASLPPPSIMPPNRGPQPDIIKQLLNDEIVLIDDGGFQRYLIH